jgi:hypothetical protein
LLQGSWQSTFGPPPGAAGCEISPVVLERLKPPGGWPRPQETSDGGWLNPAVQAKAATG